MGYSNDANLTILPSVRRMPTISDAIGGLQDAISGRKDDAQKAELAKAQQDYYGARTQKTQGDIDKQAMLTKLWQTPDEKLSAAEKVVKYTTMGAHFGEAGGKAMTASAFEGPQAAIESSQVSSGRKESADNASSVAERATAAANSLEQRQPMIDANVTLRGKQGKVADARVTKLNQPPKAKGGDDATKAIAVMETRAAHLEDHAASTKDPTIKQNLLDAAGQLRMRANSVKRALGLLNGKPTGSTPEVQQPVGQHFVLGKDGWTQSATPPSNSDDEGIAGRLAGRRER